MLRRLYGTSLLYNYTDVSNKRPSPVLSVEGILYPEDRSNTILHSAVKLIPD
jgi:hypothetical protein